MKIIESFKNIKNNFNVVVSLKLLLGTVLILLNIWIIISILIYNNQNNTSFSLYDLLFMIFGIVVSILLIFFLSVLSAGKIEDNTNIEIKGNSPIASAFKKTSDNKRGAVVTVLVVYGIMLLLGIIFIFANKSINKKYDSYVEVNAVIIDIEEYTDSDGDASYNYTYQYVVNGNIYVTISSFKGNLSNPKVGDEILIKYNPNSPNDVYFVGSLNILGVLGIIIIAFLFVFVISDLIAFRAFSPQLLLGLVLLVLTIGLWNMFKIDLDILQFFFKYPWFFMVLILANVGVIAVVNGLIDVFSKLLIKDKVYTSNKIL